MYSLVYVSMAVIPFSNLQLIELLQKSRENNEGLGITGMLLYKDGNFMQVLEGEEDSVLALKAKIAGDPRHRDMAILLAGPVRRREFSDSAMGFANLNSPDVLSISGYSPFLRTPLTREAFADHPAASKELLLLFKNSRH
jgi:hypothetical protein